MSTPSRFPAELPDDPVQHLLCEHLDYDEYFEKCNDCGETREEILTAAIEVILRAADENSEAHGDTARKIYELVHPELLS